MPYARPKSKNELQQTAQRNFETLLTNFNSIPTKEIETAGVCDDWSAKDGLAHLHELRNMMTRWYTEGMTGNDPEIPTPGYTWKTMPELNNIIYK